MIRNNKLKELNISKIDEDKDDKDLIEKGLACVSDP